MNGPRYPVLCTNDGCEALAEYKIAAVWSDGTIQELKTYGLSCEKHLKGQFGRSLSKRSSCRLTEGETLSPPQIFRIESGRRDRELVRQVELEQRYQPNESQDANHTGR